MEVFYHGIKTRYAYDFPLCFPHELLMSLRNIYTELAPKLTATDSVAQSNAQSMPNNPRTTSPPAP